MHGAVRPGKFRVDDALPNATAQSTDCIPGVPFTCVSIAVLVVCSTVCASAPIKFPEIDTVGGVISGYCATGNVVIEIRPTNTITMDTTIAVTGRFIKVSAIMVVSLCVVFQKLFFYEPGNRIKM